MPSPPAKFCVSLLPRTWADLEGQISRNRQADLIELRLDYFPDANLKNIRMLTTRPLIVTFRLPAEGGFWSGSAERRISLFQAAIDAGIDYIDMEWSAAPMVVSHLNFRSTTRLVLSHHSETNDRGQLETILRQMTATKADVYKLIFIAQESSDNLTAAVLREHAREMKRDYVIHAMGEKGGLSRLLGALEGNCWTYAAGVDSAGTAPGQFNLLQMKEDYRLHEKSPKTRVVGLLGYPVAQSSGWRLHNRLIHKKMLQLNDKFNSESDFLYLNFPEPDISNFWHAWQERIHGLSVTIPHKEKIVPFLAQPSPLVEASGVCNTMIKKGGRWLGFNTDLLAIADILRPHLDYLEQGVLIIGTGATCRSAVVALQQLGIGKIFVMGRNEVRGRFLEKKHNIRFLLPGSRDISVSGIIQTTPVGMFPDVNQLPPGSDLLRKGMVVLDVIHNPPQTRFMEIARQKDCTTIGGEELFIRQAARQFEIFSGIPASDDEVRSVWKEFAGK